MKTVLAILISLAICVPGPVSADEKKIRGHYEVIGSLDKLKGAKSIEMLEFFNFSCGHCYRFLEFSKKLSAQFKDKLHHKKYPIHWGNQTPYPAMAFYIADELGIEEKFTQELFDTNFKMNINIFQPRVIRFLAKELGVEKEMSEGMQSQRFKNKVKDSLDKAKFFNAEETPTLIINKVLKVAPSMYQGDTKEMAEGLAMIFEDILNYK